MESVQPPPRYGHFSAAVGEKVCMWGGCTETGDSDLAFSVYVFDSLQETWAQQISGGYPLPKLHNGACTSLGHCFYIYGGSDGSYSNNFLHQLDTTSWTWRYIPRQSNVEGPMGKTGCGMVAHDKKLVLFGGYGYPSGPIQKGAKFARDVRFGDGVEWTNELHVFDLRRGEIVFHYLLPFLHFQATLFLHL